MKQLSTRAAVESDTGICRDQTQPAAFNWGQTMRQVQQDRLLFSTVIVDGILT